MNMSNEHCNLKQLMLAFCMFGDNLLVLNAGFALLSDVPDAAVARM